MATDKKSVLLYCDIIHTVDVLTDEEAGKLFKHYLRYINDLNPCSEDRLTALLFEPIKQNLKRDLKKWESKSLKNSESAKMRWDKKDANECERIKPDAKHADIVIVTDTVTVKDKVKEIITKELLRENVFLHRKEIEKLQTQFTDEEINWMYDKLSAYKLSKGKTYKSDYGAINSWVIDRLKEEKLKEKNFAKKENNGKPTKSEQTIKGAYEVLNHLGINPDDHFSKSEPNG